MHVISAETIDELLDFPALIDALAGIFAGQATAPPRHHHAVGESHAATHLIMPAWTGGAPAAGSYLGTKIVNVFRDNRLLGLPAVLGTYLLQSGETGAPLAVIDGTRLTHWRTAAASALAARYLARPDSSRLLMVGAGALAPFLVRAHRAVRPITEVQVWNHRIGGAENIATNLRADGIAATAVSDLDAAVGWADIVSCATLSTAPLVRGATLHDGQHVDLVGAFNMAMREVDDTALQRARIFVDTNDATVEGGDVAIALQAGVIGREAVQGTLHDLARGGPGRATAAEITLFKSTGTAIEDLAAATLVWQRFNESNGRLPN